MKRTFALTVATGLSASGLMAAQVAKYKRRTRQRFAIERGPRPGTDEFSQLVTAMTGTARSDGNRVQVMRNGATLEAMVEVIGSAQQTVNCSSYIYWPGETSERFTAAFIERARAGVEVNLLLDGYGSAKLDRDHRARLQDGGVNVYIFRPVRWNSRSKINNRLHRRILVVDSNIAFSGGVGIADVWTGNAEDPDHWRETHLCIEGPAVLDLFSAFTDTWTEATSRILVGPHLATSDGCHDGIALQVTKSTPNAGATAASEVFYAAIAGAQERIWLTTAYFAPDRTFETVICEAAKRGVDVRILVNGVKVDKEIARKAGQRSYGLLLAAGVRIFEYEPTMLHAKVLLVDKNWANVGSSNLDSRSLDLDLEINVAVMDTVIVDELSDHFLEDLKTSREFDLEEWRRRPFRQRAQEFATEIVRQSL